MKTAIADVRVSRKNIESARRLVATAKKYTERYRELGERRIMELSRGQKPTRLAVMPALLLREFGIDPTREHKPGEVFTVTCGEDLSFNGDKVARGSVFYALKHLGIGHITVYVRGVDTPNAKNSPYRTNLVYDGRTEFPVSQEIRDIARGCGLRTHPKDKSAVIMHRRWAFYDSSGAQMVQAFSGQGEKRAGGAVDWVNL